MDTGFIYRRKRVHRLGARIGCGITVEWSPRAPRLPRSCRCRAQLIRNVMPIATDDFETRLYDSTRRIATDHSGRDAKAAASVPRYVRIWRLPVRRQALRAPSFSRPDARY